MEDVASGGGGGDAGERKSPAEDADPDSPGRTDVTVWIDFRTSTGRLGSLPIAVIEVGMGDEKKLTEKRTQAIRYGINLLKYWDAVLPNEQAPFLYVGVLASPVDDRGQPMARATYEWSGFSRTSTADHVLMPIARGEFGVGPLAKMMRDICDVAIHVFGMAYRPHQPQASAAAGGGEGSVTLPPFPSRHFELLKPAKYSLSARVRLSDNPGDGKAVANPDYIVKFYTPVREGRRPEVNRQKLPGAKLVTVADGLFSTKRPIIASSGGLSMILSYPYISGSHSPTVVSQIAALFRAVGQLHAEGITHGDIHLFNCLFHEPVPAAPVPSAPSASAAGPVPMSVSASSASAPPSSASASAPAPPSASASAAASPLTCTLLDYDLARFMEVEDAPVAQYTYPERFNANLNSAMGSRHASALPWREILPAHDVHGAAAIGLLFKATASLYRTICEGLQAAVAGSNERMAASATSQLLLRAAAQLTEIGHLALQSNAASSATALLPTNAGTAAAASAAPAPASPVADSKNTAAMDIDAGDGSMPPPASRPPATPLATRRDHSLAGTGSPPDAVDVTVKVSFASRGVA